MVAVSVQAAACETVVYVKICLLCFIRIFCKFNIICYWARCKTTIISQPLRSKWIETEEPLKAAIQNGYPGHYHSITCSWGQLALMLVRRTEWPIHPYTIHLPFIMTDKPTFFKRGYDHHEDHLSSLHFHDESHIYIWIIYIYHYEIAFNILQMIYMMWCRVKYI